MLHIIISILPFLICLFWLITHLSRYKKADGAKRQLTVFAAVCTGIYFCHFLYFNGWFSSEMNALWTLCSLSAYPLYYVYICKLTAKEISRRFVALILLPGIIVATGNLLWPTELASKVRAILFTIQVLSVCYFGYRQLMDFDQKLAEVYADTECRSTTPIRQLLILILCTSLTSFAVNAAGREAFATSNWLLLIPSLLFSAIMFLLNYVGFTRRFSAEDFQEDNIEEGKNEEVASSLSQTTEQMLGNTLDTLIAEQKLYLQPDLRIGDVVKQAGMCRTYVSNYINQHYGCSFSDYINQLRVKHAQALLRESNGSKILVIAQISGFSSEQSFYRNFRKFTGKTPTEWLADENIEQNNKINNNL